VTKASIFKDQQEWLKENDIPYDAKKFIHKNLDEVAPGKHGVIMGTFIDVETGLCSSVVMIFENEIDATAYKLRWS